MTIRQFYRIPVEYLSNYLEDSSLNKRHPNAGNAAVFMLNLFSVNNFLPLFSILIFDRITCRS